MSEAIVNDKEIDLVLLIREPLDVTIATLVVLKVLIALPVPFEPVTVAENTLGLENFLGVLSHVRDNSVPCKVSLGSDCFQALLLCHHSLDIRMLKHSSLVPF